MRHQVVIIGAGPAGLLLGCLLDKAGIDNVILERQTKEYVLARIRAGILEQTTVDMLHYVGAGARLQAEGIPHHGVNIAFGQEVENIALGASTGGKVVTAYGQTEVTKDLYDLRMKNGSPVIYSAENVSISDFESDNPTVSYTQGGITTTIDCELIAGCDGYHGVSRASIPQSAINVFEKVYPFGWLGLLADTPPVSTEVVYANAERGFALCSMRSMTRSRYYIQCGVDDHVDNWSDDAFWDELKRRLPAQLADEIITGPSLEKSIAPLRSFVCRTAPLWTLGPCWRCRPRGSANRRKRPQSCLFRHPLSL